MALGAVVRRQRFQVADALAERRRQGAQRLGLRRGRRAVLLLGRDEVPVVGDGVLRQPRQQGVALRRRRRSGA